MGEVGRYWLRRAACCCAFCHNRRMLRIAANTFIYLRTPPNTHAEYAFPFYATGY